MSTHAAAPPFIAGIATVATLLRNDGAVFVMLSVSETSPGRVVSRGVAVTVKLNPLHDCIHSTREDGKQVRHCDGYRITKIHLKIFSQ